LQKLKLFCFPYAGGSSKSIYSQWQKHLHPLIELIPIELAGRGVRFKDPLKYSLEEIVMDAYEMIKDEIKEENNQSNYAFFGHSMGCLVAYELSHRLKMLEYPEPLHIFYSGHRAPNLPRRDENLHHLPNDEFKKGILELGGTPREVLEHSELMELMLPVLRADFTAVETYRLVENEKLTTNITILNGKEDDMTLPEIVEWKKHTVGTCHFYEFTGDHFFINNQKESICKIINYVLIEK
jgi:medium-chain acyl-[acyl-carrier-protein] hydrolase